MAAVKRNLTFCSKGRMLVSNKGFCFSRFKGAFDRYTLPLFLRAKDLCEGNIRKMAGRVSDKRGATVAEYALVLAIVVVGLILVLGQLGEALREKILEVIDQLKGAPTYP